jgi:hypothetical protein
MFCWWLKKLISMPERGTNIMENQVKMPIQNYFEKVFSKEYLHGLYIK